ncbi:hypothetical protein ACQCN2_08000 [Brevibacillus ginsengisoli]|uniref:hypothetical protein n=1 Tax=Brevibacillus ginsengisoli TaxID=363854 RepID=UPI003CF96F73
MVVSPCCGAPVKMAKRPDHPLVYDDTYDFQTSVYFCTMCGKELVQSPVSDPTMRENSVDKENLM